MRFLLLLAGAVCCCAAEFDHSSWDRALKAHVNDRGEVDYAAMKNDADLKAYRAELSQASPRNKPALFPDRNYELAYWINAYNAFTTYGVSSKYPVASVRDLGLLFGFFRAKEYVAGGATMSLNNIEHDTLRKEFHEPRIHFAIVCASLGCPKLAREAYRGKSVQEQLARQTREFVAETRNIEVDTQRNEVTLSKILDWYGGDFGGQSALIGFITGYADGEKLSALKQLRNPKIRFRDYDWRINDPGSRK